MRRILATCAIGLLLTLPCRAAVPDPALSSRVHLKLTALEPIQIVQDSLKTVPLVAGRATVIRAFVTSTSHERLEIKANLKIAPRDGSPPTYIPSSPFYLVDERHPPADVRASLGLTLNFIVPASQIREGEFDATVEGLSIYGPDKKSRDSECADCAHPTELVVYKSYPLNIRIVAFSYMGADGGMRVPSDDDKAAVKSWLRRAYPATDINPNPLIVQGTLSENDHALRECIRRHWADDPSSEDRCCDHVNFQLWLIRNRDRASAGVSGVLPTHYYGLVPEDSTQAMMRGCADHNQLLSSSFDAVASGSGGSMKDPAGKVIPDRRAKCRDMHSIAGCRAIHEVGHLLGRQHPGICTDETKDDKCFPFDAGQLAPPRDFVGLDIEDATLTHIHVVRPASAHDMMTYCDQPWPSAYTVRALMKSLECENEVTAAGQQLRPDCAFNSKPFVDYALGGEQEKQSCQPIAVTLPPPPPPPPSGPASAEPELSLRTLELRVAQEQAAGAAGPAAAEPPGGATPQQVGLGLVATVDLKHKKAQIVSLTQLLEPPPPPLERAASGNLLVVIKNSAGKVEFSVPTVLRSNSEMPNKESGFIFADLPISSDSRAVEVLIDGEVFAQHELTGQFADFELDTPQPARVNPHAGPSDAERTITLSWHLAKEDAGKKITFSLQRSDEKGGPWQTLVADLDGDRVTIPTPLATARSFFRIIATNGTYSIVKTFQLPLSLLDPHP
jgi:hypothetical protein